MSSKGLILVTGANGYIAARSIEALLDAGYSVRGTVRSIASAQGLPGALSKYGDRLELVEVPDITTPDAFDEAMKGIDAVAHLAAPVSMFFQDPEPVMKAAVEGATRAFESALKEPSVRSFIFMSSIAAVRSAKEGDYVFTEKDWNETAEAMVAKEGRAAPGPAIYAASKTAAEKAIWNLRRTSNPSFTVTAINPCFVMGPPLVVPASSEKLGETYKVVWDVLTGVSLENAGLRGGFPSYVDVRDVARLVVLGVEHPGRTDGERFIAASAWAPNQAIADILRDKYPEKRNIIDEGKPGEGYSPGYSFPPKMGYDGSKAVRVSGRDYIPFQQTVIDTAEALKHVI